MNRLCAIALCLLVSASAPAFAVQPDEVLPDPALEARARILSQELRCLVCQNQSIDDSDALLARDLRLLLRERWKRPVWRGLKTQNHRNMLILLPDFSAIP